MSTTTKRAFGFVMICIAVLGLVLSVFLVVELWRVRQPVINGLQTGLDRTSSLLQTTDSGLQIIDQVVSNVYSSTVYLDDATQALVNTMNSTSTFIDSADVFVGTDLMTTITNTQAALGSAEASAAVIDNILGSIASIPFIGLNYNPGTPLHTALGDVSASLDPVQNSLKSFQTNLDTAKENMLIVSQQISSLNSKVKGVNENLLQAKETLKNYRTEVSSLKASIVKAKANLSIWVTGVIAVLTITIVILIILLIAIMLQGITLVTSTSTEQLPPDQNS